jgi:hypothetical protein
MQPTVNPRHRNDYSLVGPYTTTLSADFDSFTKSYMLLMPDEQSSEAYAMPNRVTFAVLRSGDSELTLKAFTGVDS